MLKLVLLIVACAFSVLATPSREARIIYGERAPNTPFHVHIVYLNNAVPPAGFFGGGVLISNQHVLTVASNIVGFSQWRLSFGSTTHAAAESHTSTVAVAHPLYSATTRMYDIGVINLPLRILFTPHISPISLPQFNVTGLPLENEQGVVYGFGYENEVNRVRSEFLMMAFKRTVSQELCASTFSMFPNVLPTFFCANDLNANICVGDLGGAFTTFYRQEEILTGLSSIVLHVCRPNTPSAYTRITDNRIRQWINGQTGV